MDGHGKNATVQRAMCRGEKGKSEQCQRFMPGTDQKQKTEPKEPDVMSHILEAGNFFKNDKLRERLLLMGDARLLIVAGSDTTATTLVYCFYHIAKDPSIAKKLREEMKDKGIENNSSFSVPDLQYLGYLNGIINETLRLHPPVPGGVFRHTPREGVVIDGKHLPGGVKVLGPHYTIQRCQLTLALVTRSVTANTYSSTKSFRETERLYP
jgi:cytochrome P450